MSEVLGIALELAERRKALAPRLSRQAHAAVFKGEVFPLPPREDSEHLRRQLNRQNERYSDLQRKVRMLEVENERLQLLLAKKHHERLTVRELGAAYFETLALLGATIDGEPWTLEHIKMPRRARAYADVRHVLMNLCRLLTKQSYPSIAHNLGGRHHTSVMHAVRMAPKILERNPVLRQAHQIVFSKYKSNGVTSDTAPAGDEVDGRTERPSHPSSASIREAA